MAYKRTNWEKGDNISSEKLNNIESGIDELSKAIFPEENTPLLVGEAVKIDPIEGNSNVMALTAKFNALIEALKARGVLA